MYHAFKDVLNKAQTRLHYNITRDFMIATNKFQTNSSKIQPIHHRIQQTATERVKISTSVESVVILWRVVLLQAFAHAFVAFSVTVFGPSMEIAQLNEAFVVFGIASSATIEQVQTQELALVFGFLLEDNCRSQDTVDWHVLKLVEAAVYLLREEIQFHDLICYMISSFSRQNYKFTDSWKLETETKLKLQRLKSHKRELCNVSNCAQRSAKRSVKD